MFDAPNTRRNRIAAGIAVALGLAVGFYFAVSDKGDDAGEASAMVADGAAVTPKLPATPSVSRDAATGQAMMAGGAAVMPGDLAALNPSDYDAELARLIPIEVGMDAFAAKDELLVYYNTENAPMTRVSSTEATINGATVYVIRRTGLADDSVTAEESYAVFDSGKLVSFGSRIKCGRGDTAGVWTTELCP